MQFSQYDRQVTYIKKKTCMIRLISSLYGCNVIFDYRYTIYLTKTVLYIKITVSYRWCRKKIYDGRNEQLNFALKIA